MKAILRLPAAYRLLHALFGTSRLRRFYAEEFIRPEPGSRVVDIGCGTADILEYLPAVSYFGVDHNPQYISYDRIRFPSAQFHVASVGLALKDLLPAADIVMANAILHHLTDEEASALFETAKGLVSENGRLVTLDNQYRPKQNPISRFLIANDRGKFVRTREQYAALAAPHFRSMRCVESSRLLRIPYDIIMFEFMNPIL